MTPFERWAVWLTTLATGLTGLGFFWAKYLVQPADPWAVVHHPLEPWFLKLHVVTAPLFVFAIGLVATRHIVAHLRRGVRRARASGLTMVVLLVPLTASGYLIQVVTGAGWLRTLALVHIVAGCVYLAGSAVHGVALALARRSQRSGTGGPGDETFGPVLRSSGGKGAARSAAREKMPARNA